MVDVSDPTGAPPVSRRHLPSGTVTFLFTDVVDSTRLWEVATDAMREAMAQHDALIDSLVEQHGGVVVRPRSMTQAADGGASDDDAPPSAHGG